MRRRREPSGLPPGDNQQPKRQTTLFHVCTP